MRNPATEPWNPKSLLVCDADHEISLRPGAIPVKRLPMAAYGATKGAGALESAFKSLVLLSIRQLVPNLGEVP